MMSPHLKTALAVAVTLSTLLLSSAPASAGAFNVKPIRVFLNKDTNSTVLTIENQDTKVLRLQVRAFAWTNDVHGQPVLTPSDDLIVFPTLIDIQPMAFRSIRIGFNGNGGDKELTYRIALDEMPSLESQLARNRVPGLEVRTRITVPIFITPMMTVPKAQISSLAIARGVVHGTFSNGGNVHATVSNVEIVGRDASGVTLFDKQVSGWYVLAAQDWQFQASAGDVCSRLKSLSVTVQSDVGRFSRSADTSAAGCR